MMDPTQMMPNGPRAHAFIVYWPPPKNSRKLRLAVKDIIDVKGVVTTAGSAYFKRHNPPATEDAACLAIARERGVQIVGKANMSEFAISPSGLNSYFGTPINPHFWTSIPGGSSSGSAVAIATNQADVAFGSDTTGSIRLPAACCGIVGLKTTLGLVPLKGVYPIESEHLDTVGPMAKDIATTAVGMDLLERGFAAKYASAIAAKPAGQNILVGRIYLPGTNPAIDKAVDEALEKAGFQVAPLDRIFREHWVQASRDTTTVAAAGAWLTDAKYSILPGISGRTKAVIALGLFEYNVNYQSALRRLPGWERSLKQVFDDVDFIALPTVQQKPPVIPMFGGSALFEEQVLGVQNTAAVNFAGNPALALPIPLEGGSFTSLQLVGPKLSEAGLLNAGRIVEAAVAPGSKTAVRSHYIGTGEE